MVLRKVITPGSGGGGGGSPTGGSEGLLIKDAPGAMDVYTEASETNAALLETFLSELFAESAETNATPVEEHLFDLTFPGEMLAAQAEAFLSELAAQSDETNATQVETQASDIALTGSEANAAQAETSLSEITQSTAETNASQTEGRATSLRYWGSGAVLETDAGVAYATNHASYTASNPPAANGQNDGTRAIIRTNLSALDTVNPVVLRTPQFNVPSSGISFTAARVRMWFNAPARTAALDTITFQYRFGTSGTWTTFHTYTATTATNHDAGTFTFEFPGGTTLANLNALQMRVRYQAAVVATPETEVRLDAWAAELDVTI